MTNTAYAPLPHTAHPSGIYTSDCTACRIAEVLDRIRELAGEPPPRDAGFLAHARAKFRCFLWSDGQVRTLETAAHVGMTLRDVVAAVHEARAEVGGAGKRG